MRRTPGTPDEHVIHDRDWRGAAFATGLIAALLLLASCGSSGDPSADAPSESEPAAAVERIADPDPDCGPAPTSLSAAMASEADGTDCFHTAPVTITAEVAGTIDLLISAPPAACAVEVLNTDGSTNRSLSLDSTSSLDSTASGSALALDAGEGVILSDADDGTCRFQVSWTPSPAASTTSTTTTAAPTTTSTTTTSTTTTTTTTTTKKPTPPPTTTSAVGS